MTARAHRILAIAASIGMLASLPMPVAAKRPTPEPPAVASIRFSGYDWTVKDYRRKIGPGPNVFSASNVAVDSAGRLHLRIERSGHSWTCAEVIANASLGYGTYTWTLESAPDLDPNAVLGLFTWNDDPAYAHREIDVEFARWGNAADPTNAQYVVQPYDAAGHEQRWTQPADLSGTVQSFTWAPGRVDFRSTRRDGSPISAWSYAGDDVPVPGGENPRINLWLFRGAAPTNGQPIEMVVERFTHTPL